MSIELKVKLKSLAEEARIIRKEELKLKVERKFYKLNELHIHRVQHIRPIARATHLAYGLIRGLGYHQIERTSKSQPNWGKVRAMVEKYSELDERKANLEMLKLWEENRTILASAA